MIAATVEHKGQRMKFRDKLRSLRASADLTQEQLAERSGVSLGALRNIEQGQRTPSWGTVVRIAKALGLSTDVFADCDEVADGTSDTNEKPPPKSRGERPG